MSNSTIQYIQHLILSLKAGRSISFAVEACPCSDIKKRLDGKKELTNVEYELQLLINKGRKGFPVLKPLENLQGKAVNQLLFEMEKHSKSAPFAALIPLFLFQVPSLVIIFLYPMISNFLKELH